MIRSNTSWIMTSKVARSVNPSDVSKNWIKIPNKPIWTYKEYKEKQQECKVSFSRIRWSNSVSNNFQCLKAYETCRKFYFYVYVIMIVPWRGFYYTPIPWIKNQRHSFFLYNYFIISFLKWKYNEVLALFYLPKVCRKVTIF